MDTDCGDYADGTCSADARRTEAGLGSSELACVVLIQYPLELSSAVPAEIPEPTVVPMVRVIPIGPVDDRIEAQSIDAHTCLTSSAHLLTDLTNPAPPSGAKVTGLAHHNRSPVAVVHLCQQ